MYKAIYSLKGKKPGNIKRKVCEILIRYDSNMNGTLDKDDFSYALYDDEILNFS